MLQKINRNVWFHLVEQPFVVDLFEPFLAYEAYTLFLRQWLDLLADETGTVIDERHANSTPGSHVSCRAENSAGRLWRQTVRHLSVGES